MLRHQTARRQLCDALCAKFLDQGFGFRVWDFLTGCYLKQVLTQDMLHRRLLTLPVTMQSPTALCLAPFCLGPANHYSDCQSHPLMESTPQRIRGGVTVSCWEQIGKYSLLSACTPHRRAIHYSICSLHRPELNPTQTDAYESPWKTVTPVAPVRMDQLPVHIQTES